MTCGLLLESGDQLFLESGDALLLEGCVAVAEGDAFSGTPMSARERDRQVFDQQLERLLREDEEILCLI